VPAADELQGSSDRLPLYGGEDYIAEILSIEEVTKPNFDGKMQDFLNVKFNIESFRDGSALTDMKDNPVENGRWIWKDIDVTRMGFKQDGTASIARQFFLAANGIADLNERIPEGDTDDLLHRKVVLSLIVYNKKTTGALANRITAIKPVSRRGRGQAQPAQPAPDVVSDEYAAAVAALVSDTDEPTEEQIAKTKATLNRQAKPNDDGMEDLPF
jgi:hypothetical protein